MSTSERQLANADEDSRRKLIIIVAVIAAILIAIVFYFLMRASGGGQAEPTLANAVRAGSPEFDANISKIVLDEPEAEQADRALGDIVMWLRSTARNFTGRTITGLEIRGMVVDHQGQPVKQRTVVVIPGQRSELEPNRTMPVLVTLEGMTDKDDRANIKLEITGFTLR